jgi:predicted dehydrogenase
MLRVGLVGTGDAGRHHARALAEAKTRGAAELVAVVGRDPGKIHAFCIDLALPETVARFASLESLLDARACDAVVLATPDGLHAEQASRAAARGMHVLVEKPLALTRADGERAVAAARGSNVHLAVGYHLRHHAAHRVAKERLAELAGTVRTIHARWAWPDPATQGWRARGEEARFWSLAALGTHMIDLAMFFAGSPVSRVAGVREPAAGVDRAAEVSLAFESGVLAHVSCAVTHRAISRVAIAGDAGEIELLGTLGARGDGAITFRAPREAPRPIGFAPVNPHTEQIVAFAAAAPKGFTLDASLLSNLDVLDRLSQGDHAP